MDRFMTCLAQGSRLCAPVDVFNLDVLSELET